MQLTNDRLFLSASDLVAFMECEHLSALDLRATHGIEAIEPSRDDAAFLVARKGDEHERAYLERLRAPRRSPLPSSPPWPMDSGTWMRRSSTRFTRCVQAPR